MVTISAMQIPFNRIYYLHGKNSLNTGSMGILGRSSLLAIKMYYFI